MVYGNAFTKLIWCNILFTLFCLSALKEVLLWQIDANGLQLNSNYSVFPNTNNISENVMNRANGDQQINSALSEQLMNIAAAAGQPMPRISWAPIIGQGGSKNADGRSKGLPLVQRTVRDSDSAVKVAAKQAELQQLLQQLYQAEATVQMEVGEVTRSQQIATEAEQMLEEATNKVRMLSSDLQAAQENAATCAMRAHTAQLQLAAHDQLMFTARQRVDALSAQMVSVQAELASVQNQFTLNESSQHLEQQGRINSIYQFQPGLTNNNQPDPAAAAAAAAAAANAGLLIVPPGQEQQANVYPVIRTPDQLSNQPQKK